METTKFFKVGDKFEHSKLIYEIRESSSCKGCSFFIEDENHCDLPSSFPCSCCGLNRLDDRNIIFVQVGEVPDEPVKSCMSDSDKLKVDQVINDLIWLADYLKSSRDLNLLMYSTIRMSISYLELQLQRLSFIKTFDNV